MSRPPVTSLSRAAIVSSEYQDPATGSPLQFCKIETGSICQRPGTGALPALGTVSDTGWGMTPVMPLRPREEPSFGLIILLRRLEELPFQHTHIPLQRLGCKRVVPRVQVDRDTSCGLLGRMYRMLAQDYVQLYTTKSLLSCRGIGTCSLISSSLPLQISLPYVSLHQLSLAEPHPHLLPVVSGFKSKTRWRMDLPRISKEKESSQSWW